MTTQAINKTKTWWVDISLLIILIGVFFALWIGSHPLFVPDEGRYSEAAREMLANHDWLIPRVNGVAFLDKPIIYYWMQATAIKWFGLNEWSVHIGPALLGILGCVMTYIAGRLLFNRRTGILAAFILATSPLYSAMARYANFDLAVATFVNCALFCFIIAMKYAPGKIRDRFLWAAYIFAGIAILTKGLIGIVFPALIIGVWILCLNRWYLLKQIHLILGLIIVFVISAPWYLMAQHVIPQFFEYIFVKQQFLRFLTPNFNNKAPVWFYLPVVLLGLFPWVVFLYQALREKIKQVWQDKQRYSTELFLLLWPLLIFLFFSAPNSKTIGYITPVLAPLVLLMAHYLSGQWEIARSKGVRCGMFAFLILALAIVVATFVLPQLAIFTPNIKYELHYYFVTLTAIFSIAIILVLLQIRNTTTPKVFYTLLFAISTCLATAAASVPHLGLTTVKPLALIINQYREPGDEIVNYEHYYQDLPFYVQGYVTTVTDWTDPSIPNDDDWQNQLWEGMQFEGKKPWLIDGPTFWQQWHSKKRMFVIVDASYYPHFKTLANGHFYMLGDNLHIYLITNEKPKTFPTEKLLPVK